MYTCIPGVDLCYQVTKPSFLCMTLEAICAGVLGLGLGTRLPSSLIGSGGKYWSLCTCIDSDCTVMSVH